MVDRKSIFLSTFIALLPLIAFIRVPGISIGFGMLCLLVLTPWLFFINLTRINLNDLAKFSCMILFCAYSMYCSVGNTQMLIGYILVMFWVIGTYKNLICESRLFGIMKLVSIIASVIVAAQILCHYVFGFHLISNIPIFLKADIAEKYAFLMNTGIDITGMYRPSAFFLEPSHFAEYGFMVLLWLLLKDNGRNKIRNAIIISFGIVLTTSGMGIAMVVGSWIVYVIWGMDLRRIENIVKAVALVLGSIVIVALCLRLPFFQSAVNRVAVTGQGYNAIEGRLFFWNYYFETLSSSQLLWGCGYASEIDKYMTGFMKLLYCSGYIGVILFYLMLFQQITPKNKFKMVIILFYSVLVFFAGMTSIINLAFYLPIFFSKSFFEQVDVKNCVWRIVVCEGGAGLDE